ncbi:PP2C family protein-serine/threonine phosphatase [Geothrix sp. 21YS21S-4]|uniref:PP2C family protein-serine/threonine phosphatase n=1 Tax=Geothrix sp. 21YS21S-4 TaxID=3068889 RepID=UPI0027B90DA5|nr:fused response regulator/phosphatase [Geothrix sp. 21YS21S-4]
MGKGVVLVVDDEAPIRDILTFYLKRAGYQVLTAGHGVEALEEMGRVRPDLIISDLRMPEMPGDELCKRVKSDPATQDVYFIILSALDGTATRIGGLSLGADDMIPKPFHAQEVLAKVDSTFRLIAMQKEIKRQNKELTAFQERVREEMELAAALQMGLLPKLPGEAPGSHYTHRYLPAAGIGGDVYAILPLPDGSTALMIADVSGHGVTAALISAMVKTSFENQVRLGGEPLAWAQGMNEDLCRSTLAEQFATAWLGRLEPTADRLRYVVAGHCAPLRIVRGARGGLQRSEVLRGKGFMLGLDPTLPFTEHETEFLPEDRLVLYTDGLVEVEREDRVMLEEGGLRRICAELPVGPEEAADAVVAQARAFNSPAPFVDDVTLVVLDRKPRP